MRVRGFMLRVWGVMHAVVVLLQPFLHELTLDRLFCQSTP